MGPSPCTSTDLTRVSLAPPLSGIRSRAPRVSYTMRPSSSQVPLSLYAVHERMAQSASASVTAAPPASATFLSLPSAINPTHLPSGDIKGLLAPAVPASGVACSSARRFIQSWLVPSPGPSYTIVLPSGDST